MMKKRISRILLALVMVLGLLPASVIPAEAAGQVQVKFDLGFVYSGQQIYELAIDTGLTTEDAWWGADAKVSGADIRPGYRFLGWSIDSDPTRHSVVTIDRAMTLTAHWEKLPPVVLTITSGEGGEAQTEQLYEGSRYTLPLCPFTAPDGKLFTGWQVTGSATDGIKQPYDEITIGSQSVTVTPQWGEIARYTVTAEDTVWTEGIWTVDGEITLKNRPRAQGRVTLVLGDGAVLTAPQGIAVGEWRKQNGEYIDLEKLEWKNTLTIEGTGKLIAKNPTGDYHATIGTDIQDPDLGTMIAGGIYIRGGQLELTYEHDYYSNGSALGRAGDSGVSEIQITGGTLRIKSGLNGIWAGNNILIRDCTVDKLANDGGMQVTDIHAEIHVENARVNTDFIRGKLWITDSVVTCGEELGAHDSPTETWTTLVSRDGGKTYASMNATLDHPFVMPQGGVLKIEEGKTLTVPAGVTLTNNGTIQVQGRLICNGTLDNLGRIENNGVTEGSGTVVSTHPDSTFVNSGKITVKVEGTVSGIVPVVVQASKNVTVTFSAGVSDTETTPQVIPGEDIVFTVSAADQYGVRQVSYRIGQTGELKQLSPAEDGRYTIHREEITDAVNLFAESARIEKLPEKEDNGLFLDLKPSEPTRYIHEVHREGYMDIIPGKDNVPARIILNNAVTTVPVDLTLSGSIVNIEVYGDNRIEGMYFHKDVQMTGDGTLTVADNLIVYSTTQQQRQFDTTNFRGNLNAQVYDVDEVSVHVTNHGDVVKQRTTIAGCMSDGGDLVYLTVLPESSYTIPEGQIWLLQDCSRIDNQGTITNHGELQLVMKDPYDVKTVGNAIRRLKLDPQSTGRILAGEKDVVAEDNEINELQLENRDAAVEYNHAGERVLRLQIQDSPHMRILPDNGLKDGDIIGKADITFALQPSAGYIPSVSYRLGAAGEPMILTADENGKYTIPAEAQTDKVIVQAVATPEAPEFAFTGSGVVVPAEYEYRLNDSAVWTKGSGNDVLPDPGTVISIRMAAADPDPAGVAQMIRYDGELGEKTYSAAPDMVTALKAGEGAITLYPAINGTVKVLLDHAAAPQGKLHLHMPEKAALEVSGENTLLALTRNTADLPLSGDGTLNAAVVNAGEQAKTVAIYGQVAEDHCLLVGTPMDGTAADVTTLVLKKGAQLTLNGTGQLVLQDPAQLSNNGGTVVNNGEILINTETPKNITAVKSVIDTLQVTDGTGEILVGKLAVQDGAYVIGQPAKYTRDGRCHLTVTAVAAPLAPVELRSASVLSGEDITFTVNPDAGYDARVTYQIAGGEVQTITGSGSSYTIPGVQVTDDVTVTTVAMPEAPADGIGYTVNYKDETLTVTEGYEVNTAEAFDGDAVVSGGGIVPGTTYYIRKTRVSDQVIEGVAAAFTLAARPEVSAPEGAYTVSETQDKVKFTVTPVDGAEYKADDGNWGSSNVFDLLDPAVSHTFYMRKAATDASFVSAEVSESVSFDKLEGSAGVSITGWTYGEAENAPSAESATNAGEPVFTYAKQGTDSFSEDVPVRAGTYTVKATFAATPIYLESSATAEFTVTPKTIDPARDIRDGTLSIIKAYDGDDTLNPVNQGALVFQEGVLKNGDAVAVDYNGTTARYPQTTVGEGLEIALQVELSGADAGNYQLSSANYTYKSGKITPATITGTIIQSGKLTYTGEPLPVSVNTDGLKTQNGQHITVKYSKTQSDYQNTVPAFTQAGEHTVYVEATAENHETLHDSFTVTIGNAAITGKVTAPAQKWTGSGLSPAADTKTLKTVDGCSFTVQYSADGVTYGDKLPVYTDAGKHKVYWQASADNHDTLTDQFVFEIQKSDSTLGVPALNQDGRYVYGDNIVVTFTPAGKPAENSALMAVPEENQAALFLGDQQLTEAVMADQNGMFTLIYDTTKKLVPAGSQQKLTVKYGGSANLNAGAATVCVTIEKASLTITGSTSASEIKVNIRSAEAGWCIAAVYSADGQMLSCGRTKVAIGNSSLSVALNWYKPEEGTVVRAFLTNGEFLPQAAADAQP